VAKYQSDNDYITDYPTLGITVNPGDTIDLPEGIVASGLTPVTDAPAKSKKADSAPADTSTDNSSTDAPAQGVTN